MYNQAYWKRSIAIIKLQKKLSGSFIGAKYRFSPYMACEHGCLYCDGRAEKYYVDGEFDRDIVIRRNLPELLQKELAGLREKGFISIGSGISDAYQPIEKDEELTRECAEVLSRYNFPVTVMTKSALVLRDLDLWSKINHNSGFILIVSLAFADDKHRKIFEPRAASVNERLNILRAFKAGGCRTGVLAMPLIPFIADTERSISQLLERLSDIGPDFIMPSSLTLRPGRQKDVFMGLIQSEFPELAPRFVELYGEARQSGAPLLAYRQKLARRASRMQAELAIPQLLPHYAYKGKTQLYDEINILLHHMIELYEARSVDAAPLRKGLGRFLEWLVAHKREYNRRRSWRYAGLEQDLISEISAGRMDSLIQNNKLSEFFKQIALERQTFNYVSLKLEAVHSVPQKCGQVPD